MKKFLLTIAIASFSCAVHSGLHAQVSAEATDTGGDEDSGPVAVATEAEAFPHSIAGKVLVVDYGNAPEGESSITNGIDISYIREVNRYVSAAVPIKLGVFNEPENVNTKRTFFGADITAQVGYPLLNERIYPYVTGGFGVVGESMGSTNIQLPAGAGLRVRLTEAASLTAQYELRKSFSDNRDNTQLGIGLHFNLGRGKFNPKYWDTDGDKVMDDVDKCPEVPGLKRYKGCPDTDGDGIPDSEDRCPALAGALVDHGCPDADADGVGDPFDKCPDVKGLVERDGCPLPDKDGDGVADDEDECPQIPGKLNGCPDTDADGIVDAKDNCPKASGPKSTGGCPDRDNDGVGDGSDRCPNIAGEKEHDGCPAIMRSQRQMFEYAVRAVRYEAGASNVSAEGYDHLNGLADILERYPDYRVHITGHASPVEVAADRMELSRQRASACATYLQSRGVPVATVALDGAKNAGILAAQILGATDVSIRARVAAYKADLADQVAAKARRLREKVAAQLID